MAPRRKAKTRYRNHLWVTDSPAHRIITNHLTNNRKTMQSHHNKWLPLLEGYIFHSLGNWNNNLKKRFNFLIRKNRQEKVNLKPLKSSNFSELHTCGTIQGALPKNTLVVKWDKSEICGLKPMEPQTFFLFFGAFINYMKVAIVAGSMWVSTVYCC